MAGELKEDNLQSKTTERLQGVVGKSNTARPNIDHLIKRILTERRKEHKKNFFILVVILAIIVSTFVFLS